MKLGMILKKKLGVFAYSGSGFLRSQSLTKLVNMLTLSWEEKKHLFYLFFYLYWGTKLRRLISKLDSSKGNFE